MDRDIVVPAPGKIEAAPEATYPTAPNQSPLKAL